MHPIWKSILFGKDICNENERWQCVYIKRKLYSTTTVNTNTRLRQCTSVEKKRNNFAVLWIGVSSCSCVCVLLLIDAWYIKAWKLNYKFQIQMHDFYIHTLARDVVVVFLFYKWEKRGWRNKKGFQL